MKKWQLYDVTSDTVIAESNEYMELSEMREGLINKNENTRPRSLIDYNEDDSKGDLKGLWIICNERSEIFKKYKTKFKKTYEN